MRLAHVAWRQASLAPIARDALDALSGAVGETVHLAQMDGGQVLYVDKRNAREPVRMFSQAGKVGPAYCTGVGKAMLAFSDAGTLSELLALQSFHRFTEHTFVTRRTPCAQSSATFAKPASPMIAKSMSRASSASPRRSFPRAAVCWARFR